MREHRRNEPRHVDRIRALGGAIVGLWAAAALTRLLGRFLFAVETHDPVTFAAVPALLLVVAAVASVVPALRAARVDPLKVLKA